MKMTTKIVCCLLAVFIMAFSLSACFGYNGYQGDHSDLYTVAVNNIFGVLGHLSNGEAAYDPQIHIIETDAYGRTLFFYSEFYDDLSDPSISYGMAFVIMQSSKDGYAYYYPDKCYIPYFDVTSDWQSISEKLKPDYFDSFKKENDWGQELDEAKCAKVEVTNQKPEGKLKPREYEFDEIIYPYEVKNGYTGDDKSFCKFSIYCETDSSGRELHYVKGMTMNTLKNGEKAFNDYTYAIIFNADGTCSDEAIAKIPTPIDSLTIITELKQNNNWNISN